MKRSPGGGASWWEERAAVRRFACHFIAAELTQLRPAGVRLAPRLWTAQTDIAVDLGADSLELLALASAFAEALHLHQSGVAGELLERLRVDDWVDIAQAGLRIFSGAMTFRTSGSVGVAKPCTHRSDALWQEACQLATLIGARRRIWCAVPSHHIYGFLFSVLLPRALGLQQSCVTDLSAGSPAVLTHALRAGDLVIGHPEFWRAAVRLAPDIGPDVIAVTSTAPCPDALADAVAATGVAALLQVYGSSETAGVGWRKHAGDHFQCFPYWQRDALEQGVLVRAFEDGTQQRYCAPDRLDWIDGERFLPAGRIDEAVQVGGVNVFPISIAACLKRHPDVEDAVVRKMRGDEGDRLKAFIVPRKHVTTAQLQRTLEAWVREQLTSAQRPRAFSFGAQLPRGQNGKLSDWMIVDQVDQSG
ncbi:MAG: AMP-binding protein [Massilia sp.]|nr:AMP-binding protein [Massilia sp.]